MRRHIEGLVDDAWQILDALHEVIVLGAMTGDADRIAFLEGIGANEMRRHLTGEADERDAVEERIRQARHGIGCAGTGGHQHHADLAAGARIALGGMHRALFMTHKNVLDAAHLEERVIDRQHCAARIAEDMLDALVLQRLHHHLGARHREGGARHLAVLR